MKTEVVRRVQYAVCAGDIIQTSFKGQRGIQNRKERVLKICAPQNTVLFHACVTVPNLSCVQICDLCRGLNASCRKKANMSRDVI